MGFETKRLPCSIVKMANSVSDALLEAAQVMVDDLAKLEFAEPVACVYNPLVYAWEVHSRYVQRYAPQSGCKALFLGMNPGPWGMAQTGVPFGEIPAVRDWMGLSGTVEKPAVEHPKRPIEGLACERSEVSGRRLWGLFADTFGSAESFFSKHFVVNYCPLVFMAESGANLTPDKLPVAERKAIEVVCDLHLARVIEALKPERLVGIGGFARKRAEQTLKTYPLQAQLGTLLHPSPASPIANREWPHKPLQQLQAMGLC